MDKVKLETENPYYKRNQINRTLKKIDKEKRKRARVLKGLIGQVMKLSKGKANPGMVTELMTQKLSNL